MQERRQKKTKERIKEIHEQMEEKKGVCVCPGWKEVIQAAINRSSHYLTLYSDCISASAIV